MKLFTRAVASILINDSRLPVMLNQSCSISHLLTIIFFLRINIFVFQEILSLRGKVLIFHFSCGDHRNCTARHNPFDYFDYIIRTSPIEINHLY